MSNSIVKGPNYLNCNSSINTSLSYDRLISNTLLEPPLKFLMVHSTFLLFISTSANPFSPYLVGLLVPYPEVAALIHEAATLLKDDTSWMSERPKCSGELLRLVKYTLWTLTGREKLIFISLHLKLVGNLQWAFNVNSNYKGLIWDVILTFLKLWRGINDGYSLIGNMWKLPSRLYWRAMLYPRGGNIEIDLACYSSCSLIVSWI
jgi:hypothetical protein